MSEQEFKSYRLLSISDPSDEMVAILMDKIAIEVRESNRKSDEDFFNNLRNAVLSHKKTRLMSN